MALAFYRRSNPDQYKTEGLLPTNGPEWKRIRTLLQKPVATATATANFLPQLANVSSDFMAYIEEQLNSINTHDFLPHINKVFLEMIGLITFDARLDSLVHPLPESSVPAGLIKAADDTNSNILETDNGLPIWKVGTHADKKNIEKEKEILTSKVS